MFWIAVGEALPVAIAIGLSPLSIVTVVVFLTGERGRSKASLFTLGWMLVIAAITTVALLVVDAVEESDAELSADEVDVVQLVVGIAFLGLAWMAWSKRPREGGLPTESKLLGRVGRITPVGAFGLGLLQAVTVVKNIPLALAGGARLGEAHLGGGQAVLAVLLFALIGSAGMVALVAVSVVGGARFDEPIAALRRWLEANMTSITVVVAIMIGSVLIGQGLALLA